ncbi:Fc.00g052820.m01.CDS01 [Cosmosporella sp. VM-42]
MPPRIPTEADFAPLSTILPHALHFPSPPESTTAILILFHGLGDHEVPFIGFAENLALPGVLAISVRGTSPLPASLLPDESGKHFHYGDDLAIDPATGDIDEDSGYEKARGLIMEKLIQETLVGKCGWEMSDIIFFGFGQGGSLALGLASKLRLAERVVDVTEGDKKSNGNAFKGVVSVGGPLPQSMVPTISAREKSKTSVLICQLEDEKVDAVKEEFDDVQVVHWKRRGVRMPGDREEVLPIMKFFADRLASGFT